MTVKIKDVAMLDYQKRKILVTGILSEDGKYVSATTIRKFKNTKADPSKGIKEKILLKWKKSANGETCTLGMGDNATFFASNVSEVDADGYATADLTPFTPTTQVVMMRHKDVDGNIGLPYPGSFLDAKVTFRNGDETTMEEWLPKSLVEAVKESIKSGSKNTAVRSKNAEYAELALDYTDEIAIADPIKQESGAAQKGVVTGATAEEVIAAEA